MLENGSAGVLGTDRTVKIAALARAAYHETHRFKGEIAPGLHESAHYDPPGTFSNACHVALVEVDVETGRVALEKFLAVEDAGRIINPMIAEGQVHGGIAQGIGNALFEEIVYDTLGNIQTATLADYLPPTSSEIPPIELHHVEIAGGIVRHRRQGLGRRRRDRRAGGDRQRRQRCAVAVWRFDRRNSGDAAAHQGGAARFGRQLTNGARAPRRWREKDRSQAASSR